MKRGFLVLLVALYGCGGSLARPEPAMISEAAAQKLVISATDSAAAARQARDDMIGVAGEVNRNLRENRAVMKEITDYLNGRCDERAAPRTPVAP